MQPRYGGEKRAKEIARQQKKKKKAEERLQRRKARTAGDGIDETTTDGSEEGADGGADEADDIDETAAGERAAGTDAATEPESRERAP